MAKQKMKELCVIRRISILFFIALLTGCSSSGQFPLPGASASPEIQFDKLYLRGVFNWWEATPAFKFERGGNRGWFVDVELIADGQPYDFRISNQSWSPGQTCGAKYSGQAVLSNSVVYIECNPGEQNLQFTPSTTGVYRFSISPASGDELGLIITKQSGS